MLLKIEWKIPSITLNNFLDHYVRILPDSAEPEKKNDDIIRSPFASPISAPTVIDHNQSNERKNNSPRSKLLQAIKGEILECIKR